MFIRKNKLEGIIKAIVKKECKNVRKCNGDCIKKTCKKSVKK